MWLQQFAWTEQSHEAKIRKRNAMPEDECLIEAEPMFCFETAVKLLYWSGFVYEDDEVICEIAVCLGVVTVPGVVRKGLVLLY